MISGTNIVIRGIEKSDALDIYKWVNIEELRSLTGTLYPISQYEHEEWINRVLTTGSTKLFLVMEKGSSRKLGTIGLKNIDNTNRNAELFISLAFSGGFGADAVETLTDYCFRHLNLHRIYLYVFESNKRAIRCYEKAGFFCEGTLINHHFNNNAYENVIVMAKINYKQ